MRTTRVKPYCKAIEVVANVAASADFRDTQGNLITCNYVSVAYGATAGNVLLVNLSGPSYTDYALLNTVNSTYNDTDANSSGFGGYFVLSRQEPSTFIFPQGEGLISIAWQGSTNGTIIINYGITQPENNMDGLGVGTGV